MQSSRNRWESVVEMKRKDEPDICSKCKTGQKHIENIKQAKAGQLKKTQFLQRERDLGMHCVNCIHNNVGKRKAKVYRKAYASFQSMDLFEPIDEDI